LIVERDGDAGEQDPGVSKFGLFIFGKIDGDGVAELSERLGKRTDHVREPSGFGERHALRSSKDNIHGASVVRAKHGTSMLGKF